MSPHWQISNFHSVDYSHPAILPTDPVTIIVTTVTMVTSTRLGNNISFTCFSMTTQATPNRSLDHITVTLILIIYRQMYDR